MTARSSDDSNAPSSRGSVGSRERRLRSGFSTPKDLGKNFCVFWLGPRCYAVDAALVGEVVTIEGYAPVPLAPEPVLGLFNLRGGPVALIDFGAVLELPDVATRRDRECSALVLRTTTTLAAMMIDRMEAVIPASKARYTPSEWSNEHPAVQGFLEMDAPKARVMTILRAATVLDRLKKLQFR
jgi:chemotaxis signal transduction protein